MPVMPMMATKIPKAPRSPKAPRRPKEMVNGEIVKELTSLMMSTVMLKSPVVTRKLRYGRA